MPLKLVGHAIPSDKSTKLTVTAISNRIELRLNDEPASIISLTDDHYISGQIGVRMYTTDNDRAFSSFDNVKIQNPEKSE